MEDAGVGKQLYAGCARCVGDGWCCVTRSAPKAEAERQPVCSGLPLAHRSRSHFNTLEFFDPGLALREGSPFSELARRIGGVSERMLAHSLQALEGDGFVLRVVYPTKPPKVEYSLIPLGRELAAHAQALTQWVETNVARVLAHRKASADERTMQWGQIVLC